MTHCRKTGKRRKSSRWIDEWLFMNDRMKKENARAYGSLRAYRRTFMAWKTCQSPLEASVENLSSDIPIHNTAMPPSSHMIFYISQYSSEFLFLQSISLSALIITKNHSLLPYSIEFLQKWTIPTHFNRDTYVLSKRNIFPFYYISNIRAIFYNMLYILATFSRKLKSKQKSKIPMV